MCTFKYYGQGASQFAIQMQQLCLNAPISIPALPLSAEKYHPGTSDVCGIQLLVLKLEECAHENRNKFQPSEFNAIQTLKKDQSAGKLTSFNAALIWAKKTEDIGDLRPSPGPWGGRASGFMAADGFMVADTSEVFLSLARLAHTPKWSTMWLASSHKISLPFTLTASPRLLKVTSIDSRILGTSLVLRSLSENMSIWFLTSARGFWRLVYGRL